MNYICVFDIETIPDTDAVQYLCPDLLSEPHNLDPSTALKQYHLNITDGKNDFLRQPLHKIVCIGFLIAKIDHSSEIEQYSIQKISHYNIEDSSEEKILSKFLNNIDQTKPRIVSFNGRSFDLPVIKYRALKYNIPMKWLYKSGDKWNGYNNRYSTDWHCDLLETLSDFGASARIKMNEVCAILGIPCKQGTSGSDVERLFLDNKLDHISKYCETDVVVTYILYLKYALQTGTMSLKSYQNSIADLDDYISNIDHLKNMMQLDNF